MARGSRLDSPVSPLTTLRAAEFIWESGEFVALERLGLSVPPMNDVTRILSAIEQGDPHASEQLLPLVYEELRRLAAEKMNAVRSDFHDLIFPTSIMNPAMRMKLAT